MTDRYIVRWGWCEGHSATFSTLRAAVSAKVATDGSLWTDDADGGYGDDGSGVHDGLTADERAEADDIESELVGG